MHWKPPRDKPDHFSLYTPPKTHTHTHAHTRSLVLSRLTALHVAPPSFLCASNIQFSLGYQVKICNAFEEIDWRSSNIANFQTRSLCYVSPSVLSGENPTMKDDIYSLGLLIYSTLCPEKDTCEALMREIHEEQIIIGVMDFVLASKLKKKIQSKKLNLELKNIQFPCTSLKFLVEECTRGDTAAIKFSAADVVQRLKKIRVELEAEADRRKSFVKPAARASTSVKAAETLPSVSNHNSPAHSTQNDESRSPVKVDDPSKAASNANTSSASKQPVEQVEVLEDIDSSDLSSDDSSSDDDDDDDDDEDGAASDISL